MTPPDDLPSAGSVQHQDAIVYRVQEMIYNARGYIVVAYLDTIEAWSTKWSGFAESPQGWFNQFSKASLIGVHQLG